MIFIHDSLKLVFIILKLVFPIDYCPEYVTEYNSLDVVPCNVSNGLCPKERFLSSEVYKCKIVNFIASYFIIIIF